ncbi:hypothetical protein, partial [Sphingobacterium hotanense]|uniref:hypothetical protein n=1 Tax=Sphingobacterium hotanense TaxID=649196 RepID=UPI0021A34BD3
GANKKVKSVEILNSENGSRIRKIEFFYSTIYTSPTFYSFLDSIKVEGSSFLDSETYRCFREENTFQKKNLKKEAFNEKKHKLGPNQL